MDLLRSKPERPLDSDCCGQGCDPCILDIYAEEIKIWEEECRQFLAGEKLCKKLTLQVKEESGPVLKPSEYNNFTIESVEKETGDSYRYRFKLPNGASLGLQAGQHVVVRGDVSREIITRQYTPVSDTGAKSFFELLIKIYETGRMSQYVKTWIVGTEVQMRGPCGTFEYQPNKYKRLYMLAVGTGIAPMAQIIQTVLNNEEDETMVTLLYGCKTYQDILLKTEIDDWSRYWNFTCTYFLSQEPEFESKVAYKYGDKVIQSRITCHTVHTVIPDEQDNFLVLICGTRSFEQDMIKCMTELNVTEQKYHKF
ncbi:NADH-cytochrome b5 reductase-like [Ruditapes philippinarum]|uniref:NADH-cytochrome b5 reductase-like n=1 Tax=Ruditapes philippinarum TaxID=129788 RepID=UPI00295ACBBD|nr:NADH-cytochrome b5 reductase-like [Ruditapes philippinarum]